MSKKTLPEIIEGKLRKVVHCEGALDSFGAAFHKVERHRQDKLYIKLTVALQSLANKERHAGRHFETEIKLPDNTYSFAIKHIPIRCYFWYSKNHKGTVFVSHYLFKNRQKLASADKKRIKKNWHLYEPN